MSATSTEQKTGFRSQDERSLGDLFSELTGELRTLVRQEVMLARVEMKQQFSAMSQSIAYMAAGGFVAYAGFLVLLGAVVLLVAEFIPAWISALLVGAVVVLIGYLLLRNGQATLKNVEMAPRATIETIKEDAQWVKDQTS